MSAALVFTLLRGSLAGNRWRSLLAVACIALGVALIGAVHTLHASALDEIDRAARLLAGTADLRVTGPRNGFDDSFFATIARHPAVAVASPVVEIEAATADGESTVRVLGIDPFRAARLQPGFLALAAAEGTSRTTAALDASAAFLTPAALARLSASEGSPIALRGPRREVQLKVAGTLPALDGGGALVVIDIAAAQLAFDRLGVIHRIDLRLAAGAPLQESLRALTAILPPGVVLERPSDSAGRMAGLTRAYRVNLTALAFMALFTGAFLVFSTLALQAARRRREFALLRALGLPAGQARAFFALEGALLGLAGAAAGTVLGLAASRAMLERFGHDLGAGFFSATGNAFSPDVTILAAIAALGVATAAAAAFAVTGSLARLDVAQALKDHYLDLPSARRGWGWPLALCLGAALATAIPPAAEIPVGGYLSILFALAAGVLAVAPATQIVLSRIPDSNQVLTNLAAAQVRSLPGHLAAMVAGIVVSLALTSAMAIMVFSFRVSLDAWLTGMLVADLYARASPRGDAVRFDPETQARIAAIPGVARIEPIRFDRLVLPGSAAPLTLIARPLSEQVLKAFQAKPRDRPAGPGPPPAWASEAAVDQQGWRVGQEITVPLAGRPETFRIAGVVRDYSRTWGALLVDLPDYRARTGDALANDIAIMLAPGTDAGEIGRAIANEFAGVPGAEVRDATYIHRRSLAIFDRTFAATYALEAAAILIALTGVTSSFAALAWSRRREFGVLRYLGLARLDVLRLLALEGATAGGVGALLGLGAGAAISVVLIRVVNRQSFHWGMEIHWPWLALALLCGSVVALCALGAAVAGRAAVAREAVHAVKNDA